MRHFTRRAATIAVVAALAVGSSIGGAIAQDQELRVAMGSPGEPGIAVWDDVAAQFEASHPGVKVEMNYQDDDLYQTGGVAHVEEHHTTVVAPACDPSTYHDLVADVLGPEITRSMRAHHQELASSLISRAVVFLPSHFMWNIS